MHAWEDNRTSFLVTECLDNTCLHTQQENAYILIHPPPTQPNYFLIIGNVWQWEKIWDDLEGKESPEEQMIIGKIRKSMNDDL